MRIHIKALLWLDHVPKPDGPTQVDRNATVEIKISEDNRQAHFDFERSVLCMLTATLEKSALVRESSQCTWQIPLTQEL